jgi:hypothetical protein
MSPKRTGRGRGSRTKRAKPLPKFRVNQRMLLELIVHMPADRMPLVAPTAVWAMHAAKPRVLDPGQCLDACLALRCALEVYGIAAHPAAVQVGIGPVGENPKRLYSQLHGSEQAHFNADGTFNGHLVLVVPHPGVFIDATVQQFPEVAKTDLAVMPALSALPSPDGLGTDHYLVRRADNDLLYVPQADEVERLIYRNPKVAANMAKVRAAGLFLASNAFDMLRQPDLRAKVRTAPYPRLQRQFDALGEAERIVRPRDGVWNFRDPQTGAEIRLSDIP